MEKDKGYGICYNEWLQDDAIKNELRLLIKISSLTAEKGFCFLCVVWISLLDSIP